VLTALTAQNTRGVQAIHDVPPAFIGQQIDSVFSDLDVRAVKIGMLSQPAVIEAVAAGLERHGAERVVLDPVMVAASGDPLLAPEAVETLRRVLIPRALLVTPNLPESAAILGESVAETEEAMRGQAERIMRLGPKAVLVKGGHASGPESADILLDGTGLHRFTGPRVATRNTHGTGCTLSSAIAAGLAKGMDLLSAVEAAKAYIGAAIAASDRLRAARMANNADWLAPISFSSSCATSASTSLSMPCSPRSRSGGESRATTASASRSSATSCCRPTITGAARPLQLHAAGGRQRSVGQHHRRLRTGSQSARRARARTGDAARDDRGGTSSARPKSARCGSIRSARRRFGSTSSG
jgi:hydroxymethylpyrimidine/phosphomethylpyrimidine kinase